MRCPPQTQTPDRRTAAGAAGPSRPSRVHRRHGGTRCARLTGLATPGQSPEGFIQAWSRLHPAWVGSICWAGSWPISSGGRCFLANAASTLSEMRGGNLSGHWLTAD